MVKQYPHTLILTAVEDTPMDGNGNWITGHEVSISLKGRAEPNSKGQMIASQDGTQVLFDWMVYMPLPADEITPGTRIVLKDEDGNQFGEGTIKRYSRGQMNARIWL
jgi:hypothetical protein